MVPAVTPDQVSGALAGVGYEAPRPVALAVAGAMRRMAQPRAGLAGLLLEGPPGAGKTALAEAIASAYDMSLVVYQAHAWTDSDELFVGVDVVAAVAGDPEGVRQPGALLRAVELAEQGPVVLLIDEIDKASERAEALLLDWLQSGRVPVAPGRQVQTRLDRVLVIATSNAVRPLSDALLRRLRRTEVRPLPVDRQVALLAEGSGYPLGLARLAWAAAREVAAADGCEALSLQEGAELLAELQLAEDVADVRSSLSGWAARGPAGRQAAARSKRAPALWGEILAARSRGQL